MSIRQRRVGRSFLRHLVLLAGCLIMLVPFIWMFSTSLKPDSEIFSVDLAFWPREFAGFDNYRAAFNNIPLARFMVNGLMVSTAILVLQILIALPCAYALAKLRFKGRNLLMGAVLLCLLVPFQAVGIPLYIFFFKLKLLDTYAALVLPFTISVFGIFLMRQFFMTVPDDLIHAARLDGMSEFGLIWRVMLPVALPAVTAFGIFSIVIHWNDYFWPLIVLNSETLYTPPLGMAYFLDHEVGVSYGPLMAAAVVAITPLVIGFLVAQKKFIEGISSIGLRT
jgi:multiple sugar transport system permease protein